MATGLNVAKLANLFRGRLTFMHELSEIYKPTITKNKEKVMELIREKAETATKSELARKMRVLKGFYTVELSPPGTGEINKLRSDLELAKEFIKTKCFNFLTVKQAWLLFLVCTEIFLWFFLGETIGKGHIVGYLV